MGQLDEMELLGSLESKIIYEKPTRDEESNSKKEKKKKVEARLEH